MNAAGNWEALKTIVFREIHRILRIWGQTLIPPAITMTLYFVILATSSAHASATCMACVTSTSSCRA